MFASEPVSSVARVRYKSDISTPISSYPNAKIRLRTCRFLDLFSTFIHGTWNTEILEDKG
jgi:hypothetical protein